MKVVSRNLKYIVVAAAAAAIGISAAIANGQDATAREKTKAEHKAKLKTFCSSNNWSSGDKVSHTELREMPIAATGSVNVDAGQNGGVSVKGEDRSDVLVRACVQTWATTEDAAKAAAANIKIATSGTIKAENAADEKGWSVSYQVLVPRATNTTLKAHNGGISITGVDGTAEFVTMNGGVHLSGVSGTVKGRTTNGGVNVSLSGGSWRGSGLDVQTTNGGVRIEMPSTYAAHVETSTVNGGFSSDIAALTVEKTDRERGHRPTKISTDLNGGGAPIRVVTINGGVQISTPGNE